MIRKLSVGVDYKSAMHYILGQEVFSNFIISDIVENTQVGGFDIYVKKQGEVRKWKHIGKCLPISIEYNLNY